MRAVTTQSRARRLGLATVLLGACSDGGIVQIPQSTSSESSASTAETSASTSTTEGQPESSSTGETTSDPATSETGTSGQTTHGDSTTTDIGETGNGETATAECETCFADAAMGPCATQQDACFIDPYCTLVGDCCIHTPEQCDANECSCLDFPQSANTWAAVAECLAVSCPDCNPATCG
jgi:hypothetical protein